MFFYVWWSINVLVLLYVINKYSCIWPIQLVAWSYPVSIMTCFNTPKPRLHFKPCLFQFQSFWTSTLGLSKSKKLSQAKNAKAYFLRSLWLLASGSLLALGCSKRWAPKAPMKLKQTGPKGICLPSKLKYTLTKCEINNLCHKISSLNGKSWAFELKIESVKLDQSTF